MHFIKNTPQSGKEKAFTLAEFTQNPVTWRLSTGLFFCFRTELLQNNHRIAFLFFFSPFLLELTRPHCCLPCCWRQLYPWIEFLQNIKPVQKWRFNEDKIIQTFMVTRVKRCGSIHFYFKSTLQRLVPSVWGVSGSDRMASPFMPIRLHSQIFTSSCGPADAEWLAGAEGAPDRAQTRQR